MESNALYNPNDEVEIIHIKTENRHIWEVSPSYRCPLIGACFDAAEHRRVLKKVGIRTKGMSLYEVHVNIMGHLRDKNRLSQRVDSVLNHKYKWFLEQFGDAEEDTLKKEWERSLDEGGFEGLFYLACVRRDISDELVDQFFGDIHMMSHAAINSVTISRKEVTEKQHKIDSLEAKLKDQKQLYQRLKKENQTLNRELESAKKRIAGFEAHQSKLSNTGEDSSGEQQVSGKSSIDHENKFRTLSEKAIEQENTIQKLKTQLEESKSFNKHLQKDIEDLILHFSLEPATDSPELDQEDLNLDLGSKKVLIVGGMTKIKHLYQHVIEANGGHFEYHDGYMKAGNQSLNAKVSRSDLIICPVNCNSHNACSKVKKLCQKHKKPLKMLSNASVTAISAAILDKNADLNSSFL